jgi:hypothetical protein
MNVWQTVYTTILALGTAVIASVTVVSFAAPEAAKPAMPLDEYKTAAKRTSVFTDGVERIRVTARRLEPLAEFYRTAFPEIKAARTGKRPAPKGEWKLTVTVGPKLRRLNDPLLILLVKSMAECRVGAAAKDSSTFVFENISKAYADKLMSELSVLGEAAAVSNMPR